VKVAILGDPTPEETAAIVAALETLFRNAAGWSTQPPSKWRKAARSLDDEFDPW
jgi:acyl-CoA carboxylase epsilon subunit-like protein